MDYKKIGFKAGLEIHQQLDTNKLFCNCPSEITDRIDYSFHRYLRPTQSELGELDKAALLEAKKNRHFLYTASKYSTCLVEADEEPPHEVNKEALETALTVAVLLNSEIMDEVHFMRKIVIDGSNTTGFQRTALIAIRGKIKDVNIETVALEEDAARKIKEDEDKSMVNYGLDRLGIPLIEVATSAELKSPEHAKEIAEYIGSLLQVTGKCKRGLGTIRQDLNISVSGGSRVEIKGIQSLSAISKVAEREVLRQLDLIEIANILKDRINEDDIKKEKALDVTKLFKDCRSNIVKKTISKEGKVIAVRLPGFNGLLKRENSKLGKEFAIHAKVSSGIGGILHSDELPNYGIDEDYVEILRKKLKVKINDAFAIFLGDENVISNALQAVKERAVSALYGVPEEVRRAIPDYYTEYMRPLPGAARMYPETDIPPVEVEESYIEELKKNLPERPEDKIKRLCDSYDIKEDQIKQLIQRGYERAFEELVDRFPNLKNTILRTFLNTFPELEREGIDTGSIRDNILGDVFLYMSKGMYSKEAIPTLLEHIVRNKESDVRKAALECGLKAADVDEIRKVVKKVISERIDFVKNRGISALSPLMGVVMKELRGRADGKLINKILKEELEKSHFV